MVTTSWSENSPLQGIHFPHGGSSGAENGLNNLGWETWVYELGPLRGQAHSFHSSGWGWNLEPPTWDRRSLLTGSSGGGPSRRDIISGNHTLPGHRGAMKVVEPGPGKLSPGLPGAEQSREMHTDEVLGHICTIASSPRGAGCVRKNQSGQWDVSQDANRSTCAWPNSLHINSTTSGWNLNSRASAPVSTGCLLLYCGPPGCKLLAETTTSLWITGGSGMPVCKLTWLQTPLVIYVGDHRCVVWVDKHMMAPEIC